jgi:hypothetical protein
MTNLLATITFVVLTNWTTTSIESPVRPPQPLGQNFVTAEYHATGYHQTGIVLRNTVATIEWKGKKVPVVLESTTIEVIHTVEWK